MDEFQTSLTRRAALLLAAGATHLHARTGDRFMGCPVVHFEIGCRDLARTGEFFSKLFDWQIQPAGPAINIDTGSPMGVQGHITALGHEPFRYTTFYVEVEDVAATLARVAELGGKKIVGPIAIPTGTFAWFSDLEGNVIGLLQPKA